MDLNKYNEYLSYDKRTGYILWKRQSGHRAKVGASAGCLAPNGYLVVRLKGHLEYAHRIAFYMEYGRMPAQVDHINRDRTDNRISNLREVSVLENNLNKGLQVTNTSGKTGVSYCNYYKKYVAYISFKGKRKTIGYRSVLEEAVTLRKNKEIELYGKEFPS